MKKTGIITALGAEAACLTAAKALPKVPPRVLPGTPIKIAPGLLLVLAGMGPARAGQAARQLIEAGVERLISFGTAGGLDTAVQAGELCMPRTILTEHATLQTDPHWHIETRALLQHAPVTLHTGALFSSDRLLASSKDKALLNRQSAAIAVDMESAAILALADAYRLPCLVLRAIVDPADMHVPTAVLRHVDHLGHARVLPLLKHLLAHPGEILPLIRLARCFRAASATLTWTAKQII